MEAGQLCERKNGRGVDTNRNWEVHWGHKEKDYDPNEEFPGAKPFRSAGGHYDHSGAGAVHFLCVFSAFWRAAVVVVMRLQTGGGEAERTLGLCGVRGGQVAGRWQPCSHLRRMVEQLRAAQKANDSSSCSANTPASL